MTWNTLCALRCWRILGEDGRDRLDANGVGVMGRGLPVCHVTGVTVACGKILCRHKAIHPSLVAKQEAPARLSPGKGGESDCHDWEGKTTVGCRLTGTLNTCMAVCRTLAWRRSHLAV